MGKNTLPVAQLRRKRKAEELQRKGGEVSGESDDEDEEEVAPASSAPIEETKAHMAKAMEAYGDMAKAMERMRSRGDQEKGADAAAASDSEDEEEVAPALPASKEKAKALSVANKTPAPKFSADSSDDSDNDLLVAPSAATGFPKHKLDDADDFTADEESDAGADAALLAKSKPKTSPKLRPTIAKTPEVESEARDSKKQRSKTRKVVPSNLTAYVGSIPWSTSEEMFAKHFAECGDVETLVFPVNKEKKSKGRAFITFETQEGLEAALKLDGEACNGRPLKVQLARDNPDEDKKTEKDQKKKKKGNEEKGPEFTVFLVGYSVSITEEWLRKDFGQCGEIKRIRIPQGQHHAFIEFTTKEGAEKACGFNETDYMGSTLRVSLAKPSSDTKGSGKGSKDKAPRKGEGRGKGKAKGTVDVDHQDKGKGRGKAKGDRSSSKKNEKKRKQQDADSDVSI